MLALTLHAAVIAFLLYPYFYGYTIRILEKERADFLSAMSDLRQWLKMRMRQKLDFIAEIAIVSTIVFGSAYLVLSKVYGLFG